MAQLRLLVLLLTLTIQVLASHHKYLNTIERYSHPNVLHHRQLLFDVPNFKLLVAARDYILSLSLENFDKSHKTQYFLPADSNKVRSCMMKGMANETCHNFITALLPLPVSPGDYHSTGLLVCGTNAFSPDCEVRRLDALDTLLVGHTGLISAYNPLWNTTTLITSSGQYFYGGPLDLRGIDSSITKQKVSAGKRNMSAALTTLSPDVSFKAERRIIRSAQHDSKWINVDANFVSSFEFEQHVYFLFRETAVEYLNCGKRIYSRIGRVCQNDRGMRNNWTSFLKARLNCSLPGLYPFYFDEIQSAHITEVEGMLTLYAIFNTPPNSIHGSAVCAFTMESVQRSFDGPFKYQASSSHAWESVNDNKDTFECRADEENANRSSNPITTSENYDSRRRLNSVYQLMDQAVQSVHGRPLTMSTQYNFKHIVVDVIDTKYHKNVEITFIATTDGRLLRYVRWPTMNESCFLDQQQLTEPEDEILTMKFLKDTNSIYVGTVRQVMRVPVQRCQQHGHTREACLAAQDPYCGWSVTKMKCTKAPGNNYHSESFIQSPEAKCTQGQWSEWFTCPQHIEGDGSAQEQMCKCRRRPCSESNGGVSVAGGKCLDGWQIEVGNCTRNGGWSEWSAWGSCHPSCVHGQQNRTRACTNPAPSGGGLPCEGNAVEHRQCERLPYCNWTPWSEWSPCPINCSVGHRQRNRTCIDFSGRPVGEDYCYGMPLETAACECELQWSDWYVKDISSNEVVEARHQVRPSGSNAPAMYGQSEQRVRQLKYCDRCEGNIYNFKEKEYLIKECSCNNNIEWSDWSPWSDCVNNTQRRSRSCLLAKSQSCKGHYIEISFCFDEDVDSIYNVQVLRSAGIGGGSHSAGGQGRSRSSEMFKLFLVVIVATIISSVLTWTVCLFLYKRNDVDQSLNDAKTQMLLGSSLLDRVHLTEPNTYEEPDKYRVTTPLNTPPSAIITTGGTLTRQSTLKRDLKNTSFRAKLDDSNYT